MVNNYKSFEGKEHDVIKECDGKLMWLEGGQQKMFLRKHLI